MSACERGDCLAVSHRVIPELLRCPGNRERLKLARTTSWTGDHQRPLAQRGHEHLAVAVQVLAHLPTADGCLEVTIRRLTSSTPRSGAPACMGSSPGGDPQMMTGMRMASSAVAVRGSGGGVVFKAVW